MNDVQQGMARGAMWMVLFKLMERSLGLISTLILVRRLAPADFGIVAMATSFIFMAELLAAFSFDVALIQNQNATEEDYHTAWTCNLLLGAAIAVLMLAAAPLIAAFYNEPAAFWVVCLLALGPLISGAENIGVVAFRKDMQFRREFAFQLSRKVMGFMVVVPMAIWLRSYWALVAGILTSKLAGTIVSYAAHPFRPRFSLVNVRGLLRFSKWMLFNNMIIFLKERGSDFVIGRLHGSAALGKYNVSYEFASMPMTELSAPINRALLPGFARIAHDPSAVRAAYINAMSMLAILAVPAAAGIFAVAPFLAPVVLGSKWIDTVPLMEILALNGGLLLFHSSICTVLVAKGRPDRVTRAHAIYVVMLLAGFALLVPGYGVIGAAGAALAASVLATPIYLRQVRNAVDIPASSFVRSAIRPMMAAVAMAFLVRTELPVWNAAMTTAESSAWLISGIALGMAAYASTVLLLWFAVGRPDGAERILIDQLWQRLGIRRTAPGPILP